MIKGPTYTIDLEEDNIVHVVMFGDDDDETATRFIDDIKSIFDKEPKQRFNGLIDLTNAGTSTPRATKIFASILSDKQVNKVALIGAGGIPRAFAELTIKFARKELVQFFDTREEALAWLKS